VEPAELEAAARVHSAASAPQLHDGTRLLQSLVVPPRMCCAFFCLLFAQALVIPLVFSDAVTGDALWGPFARYVCIHARASVHSLRAYTALVERFKVSFGTADKVQSKPPFFLGRHRTRDPHSCVLSPLAFPRPGTYLNVEVVRAQGLQLRHGSSGSHPGDAETTSTQTTDASLLPAPYVNVVTWPWSKCVRAHVQIFGARHRCFIVSYRRRVGKATQPCVLTQRVVPLCLCVQVWRALFHTGGCK
jgi:hypothetical protein